MDLFPMHINDSDASWRSMDNQGDFKFYDDKLLDVDIDLNPFIPEPAVESDANSSNESIIDEVVNTIQNGVNKQQKVTSRRKTLSQRSKWPPKSVNGACKEMIENQQSDDDDNTSTSLSSKSFSGLSKNAIAARENRIRKKKYVEGLEKSVKSLGAENNNLKIKNADLEDMLEKMSEEIIYLRNVLSNIDDVANLVESIRSVNKKNSSKACNGFLNQHDYSKITTDDHLDNHAVKKRRFDTAFFDDDRDEEENKIGRRLKTTQNDKGTLGGVCIHVNKGQMSLEFCPRCSGNANSTWAMKSTE